MLLCYASTTFNTVVQNLQCECFAMFARSWCILYRGTSICPVNSNENFWKVAMHIIHECVLYSRFYGRHPINALMITTMSLMLINDDKPIPKHRPTEFGIRHRNCIVKRLLAWFWFRPSFCYGRNCAGFVARPSQKWLRLCSMTAVSLSIH